VNITASLEGLKRQASGINEQDVQLRALDREAKAQRELLETYLARYREAAARDTIASAPTNDLRVISRAAISNTPYFPKKLPTVLVATLAALMLSAGFLATGEIMRGGSGAVRVPVATPAVADVPVREAAHPAVGVPVSAIADVARRLVDTAHLGRRVAVFNASSASSSSLAALT